MGLTGLNSRVNSEHRLIVTFIYCLFIVRIVKKPKISQVKLLFMCFRLMAFDVKTIRGRKRLDEVRDSSHGVITENGLPSLEQKILNLKYRRQLVLWRSPLRTLYYFVLESGVLLRHYGIR